MRKDPPGPCLLGAGWCFHKARYVNIWKMASPPSYHPLLVLTSLQPSLPMLRGRTPNLLLLPHLVFENGAGHIHPCFGTGSDTAQSTLASLQRRGLELQSSKNTCLCRCPEAPPGSAQTRSGLHQSRILHTFPLQGLKKLLLLLVVWHGACWHAQPSSSSVGSEATGNDFISHLTGQTSLGS